MKINKLLICLVICFISTVVCIYLLRNLFKNQNQDEICLSNLKKLGNGFYSYALDHEGALPPISELKKDKFPTTWVSHLWPYIKDKDCFCCPAANEKENSYSQLSSGALVKCSYGMFVDTPTTYGFSSPLLSDSTHGDFNGIYSGKKLDKEGFKIDKDNKKKIYTQLSFYHSSNGFFDPLGKARHGHNIHVLLGNGTVKTCGVKIAYFKK